MKKFMHLILTLCLIGTMCFSSFAADMYVYDDAGLLEAEELAALDAQAAAVSEKHGCGVYVITLNDYTDYSTSDVYTTATEMYHGLDLGEGAEREGILLMLSMSGRDYATFFYGEHVEYAFDEYGQIQLEDQFLDDFADNRWYDGFSDYVSVCDEYLGLAAEGNPVREDNSLWYVIAIGAAIVQAFVTVNGLKESMNSVHKGGSAATYATNEGLQLTVRGDYFLYNTQTRRKIESSSGESGSKSHSGGGGSGRSGKF